MKKKEGKNKKQEPISISKKKNDLRRAAVGDDSTILFFCIGYCVAISIRLCNKISNQYSSSLNSLVCCIVIVCTIVCHDVSFFIFMPYCSRRANSKKK